MSRFWIEIAWRILVDVFHLSQELRTFVFLLGSRKCQCHRASFSVLCRVTRHHILRHFHYLSVVNTKEIPGLSWQTAWMKGTNFVNGGLQDFNCHRGNLISSINQMCVWFVYVLLAVQVLSVIFFIFRSRMLLLLLNFLPRQYQSSSPNLVKVSYWLIECLQFKRFFVVFWYLLWWHLISPFYCHKTIHHHSVKINFTLETLIESQIYRRFKRSWVLIS